MFIYMLLGVKKIGDCCSCHMRFAFAEVEKRRVGNANHRPFQVSGEEEKESELAMGKGL